MLNVILSKTKFWVCRFAYLLGEKTGSATDIPELLCLSISSRLEEPYHSLLKCRLTEKVVDPPHEEY